MQTHTLHRPIRPRSLGMVSSGGGCAEGFAIFQQTNVHVRAQERLAASARPAKSICSQEREHLWTSTSSSMAQNRYITGQEMALQSAQNKMSVEPRASMTRRRGVVTSATKQFPSGHLRALQFKIITNTLIEQVMDERPINQTTHDRIQAYYQPYGVDTSRLKHWKDVKKFFVLHSAPRKFSSDAIRRVQRRQFQHETQPDRLTIYPVGASILKGTNDSSSSGEGENDKTTADHTHPSRQKRQSSQAAGRRKTALSSRPTKYASTSTINSKSSPQQTSEGDEDYSAARSRVLSMLGEDSVWSAEDIAEFTNIMVHAQSDRAAVDWIPSKGYFSGSSVYAKDKPSTWPPVLSDEYTEWLLGSRSDDSEDDEDKDQDRTEGKGKGQNERTKAQSDYDASSSEGKLELEERRRGQQSSSLAVTSTAKRKKISYTISEDLSGDAELRKRLCILKERPSGMMDMARVLRDRKKLV